MANPASFFQETTPLNSMQVSGNFCCNLLSLNHKARITVKKIMVVIGVIVWAAACVFDIDNAVKTWTTKHSNLDLVISISGVVAAFFLSFCFSAYAGTKIAEYQNLRETSPISQYNPGRMPIFDFIDKGESVSKQKKWRPYLNLFFEQMRSELKLEEWLKFKNFKDKEEGIDYLTKRLGGGLCYGTTMALVAKMFSHAKSESVDLVENLVLENIVFYQLTHNILSEGFSEKFDTTDSLVINEPNLTSLDCYRPGLKDQIFFKHANLIVEDVFYFEERKLHPMDFITENKLDTIFNKGRQEIESLAAQKKPSDVTLCGEIGLYSKENDLKERYAHAIFFQISDGFFRFHDSGSKLKGFFEFSSEELLLENLCKHITAYTIGWEWMSFTFFGIPHATSSTVINIT